MATLRALLIPALLAAAPVPGSAPVPASGSGGPAGDGEGSAQLAATFAAAGIYTAYDVRACAIDVSVGIRDELLEYLLCLPFGAAHESLFVTEVDPETLNTALLTLGVEPGTNAQWAPKVPAPSEEELRAGASAYDVVLPEGDGFYMYAAWREGDETYLYRVEDLVRDLSRGRTMERHRWVYLGSRMAERGPEREVVFAAAMEGNLVNLAFFSQGYTLVTPALESCVEQTIWLPNAWLLPPMRSPALLVFSRERLGVLPPTLADRVPLFPVADEPDPPGARTGER